MSDPDDEGAEAHTSVGEVPPGEFAEEEARTTVGEALPEDRAAAAPSKPAPPVEPKPAPRRVTPPALPATPAPKRTATPPAIPVTPAPKRTATPLAVATTPATRTAPPPAGTPAATPARMSESASVAATTPVALPGFDAEPTGSVEGSPTPAREPVVPARSESPVKLVPPLPAESEPGTPEEIERPNRVRTPPAGVPRRAPRARTPSPVAEDRPTHARTISSDPVRHPQSYRTSRDALLAPRSPAVADPPAQREGRVSTAATTDFDASESPTVIGTASTPWPHRLAGALPWLVIALPALYQLFLLSSVIIARIAYPYDLEWMEGGMLHHALRIHNGEGIYVPPSIDFIPYLYTPLYPSLLAMLGGAFGLTYTLGRAISVLALLGIAIIGALQIAGPRHEHGRRAPAWAGVALALGLFASVYPFMKGWFDLVRADTLFLFMITAGIAGLPRWARTRTGLAGHGQIAAGATLLALAFFCKQTGILYVAFGGVVVLVLAWRRAPIYAATAGLIGLGGTWLLNRTTHGWFWTYVSEIHRAHDFNMDRFWKSFGNILWHIPALTIVVGVALVAVLVTRIAKKTLPRGAHPLLLWSATFAMSTLVGAIGWGTEFAEFNAYMPAFLHGALAAGAAIPALYACARVWWGDRRRRELVTTVIALAAAVPLALACWHDRWEPREWIPTRDDESAAGRLVARVAAIDGEVWIPFHPWYAYLAGKTPHVHRMGVIDVTRRQARTVEGLDEALRDHAFAAIVFDDRDVRPEFPQLATYYRPILKLSPDERPRLFSGAKVTPETIWVPAIPATPPAGAKVIADFEAASWTDWTTSGAAWGKGPAGETLPGQDLVLGATGQRFATSMHGGDAATGRVTSPVFALDGAKLTLRIGGGTDATKLRVELWVDDALVKTASVAEPGGDALRVVTLELGTWRGKHGKLVFVDDSPLGHLDVDDVWLWP